LCDFVRRAFRKLSKTKTKQNKMKDMKELQAQLLEQGQLGFAAIIEVRGHTRRVITYTNKADGKTQVEMEAAEISAEFIASGSQVKLEMTSPKGQTRILEPIPARGEKRVVRLLSLTNTNGSLVGKIAGF